MSIVVHKTKNNEGSAAASIRSWEAYSKAFVENVSKLNGLSIKVIGNSFIISNEIRINIKNVFSFKIGK